MFFRGKRVLVTGGTGFIGARIVRELLSREALVRMSVHTRSPDPDLINVETVSADLMQWEDCRKAAEGVDYVIHAAGTVGAAGVKSDELMDGIRKNLVLTANILQASWAEGVRKIIIFGSSTGYPAYSHPVKEEEMWLEEPHSAYFGYGWMRRYFEKLGEHVSRQSECQVVVIRPSAVYGPEDHFAKETNHVIPALIKRAVRGENPYVVWGSGREVRDFIHVSDFARACLLALEKGKPCDPINIGAGTAVTIQKVVGLILKAAGRKDASVVFDIAKPATIPFRMVDVEKARRLLGFEPLISLEQGIKETVQWYINSLVKRDSF